MSVTIIVSYYVVIFSSFNVHSLFVGSVPYTLCNNSYLSYLDAAKSNSNTGITCSPISCLTSVTVRYLNICKFFQDDAICGFISATNIQYKSNYTEWSCTTNHKTATDPCNFYQWTGVNCTNGIVSAVFLGVAGISGIILILCQILS